MQAIVRREATALGAEVEHGRARNDGRDGEGHDRRSPRRARRPRRPGRARRCATRTTTGCSRSRKPRTGDPPTRRAARPDRNVGGRGSRRRRPARARARPPGTASASTSARPAATRRFESSVRATRSCSTAPPELLPNGRVLSAALDDRAGSTPASRPPATRRGPGRLGLRRRRLRRRRKPARTAARAALRSGSPGGRDHPRGHLCRRRARDRRLGADVRLGGGPAVFRGPVVSPVVGPRTARHCRSRRGITVAIETGKSTGRTPTTSSRRRGSRLRHGLDPASLHALGRGDRAALRRRRRRAADRGVRAIAHARESFLR